MLTFEYKCVIIIESLRKGQIKKGDFYMKRKALFALMALCLCVSLMTSLISCGVAGETGPVGPQGEKGDTGAVGPQGEKGDTGAVGPQGEKGDAGDIGSQGEKGDIGPVGPQGNKGDTGVGIQEVNVEQLTENGQRYMIFTITYTDGNTKTEKVLLSAPEIVVKNTAEAQAALDNATSGDLIRLAPGRYGALYLRQSALSTSVDVSDWAGNADVERYRSFDNITIIGGDGVEVEGLHVEAGTYANTTHSNYSSMPYLESYIAIKDLLIKDVNFVPESGKTMISMSGAKLEVDGLYFEGCTLTYSDTTSTTARLIYQDNDSVSEVKDRWNDGECFMTKGSVQNISIVDCTITNAHQIIELRNAKNITISKNTFINTRARDILLAMGDNGHKFSGKIIISDNTSTNSTERFARISGVNAVVTVSGNTVNASSSFTESLIKFSSHEGSLITFANNNWNGYNDKEAISKGLVEK